ncbi:MAG TPA: hypothetical protein VF068_05415 [Rubrobacter sp.]
MSETEAVEVAADYARREGYDTGRYDVEAEKQDVRWEIHFQRKGEDKPRPGDFFTVHVDDVSGSVQRIVHGK